MPVVVLFASCGGGSRAQLPDKTTFQTSASKAPELFSRSANVFVRLSEADSAAHKQYIDAFLADTAAADTLASFRAE